MDIVTDHIKTVIPQGLELKSGQILDADIIVTATGLKMRVGGGVKIFVDGSLVNISEKFMWKGCMLQDCPNAAFVSGYTDNSWTLGADATAQLVCRLLKRMQTRKEVSAVPRIRDSSAIKVVPSVNLTSTYVKVAVNQIPKAGNRAPWQPRRSYLQDIWEAKFGNLSADMEFSLASSVKKEDL